MYGRVVIWGVLFVYFKESKRVVGYFGRGSHHFCLFRILAFIHTHTARKVVLVRMSCGCRRSPEKQYTTCEQQVTCPEIFRILSTWQHSA